jgi:hypothetical protein
MVLDAAGDNRKELEKVIDHYKSTGDEEKLKAAYFLIGNMDDKYALDGEVIRRYDPLFNYLKSIREKNQSIKNYSLYINYSKFIESAWDSFATVLGPLDIQEAKIVPDYQKVKADYLIRNIDQAFATRDASTWGKKFSFDQFCEYLLAYRFKHEPLENWREYYHDKYHSIWDTLKVDSCCQLGARIFPFVPRAKGLSIFNKYPFELTTDQMEASLYGTCAHVGIREARIMRSAGLLLANDFTINFGNINAGHEWNALLMENGKTLHYEGYQDVFGYLYRLYRYAKVYRNTFGRQYTDFHGHEEEIPNSVRNDHIIDVTPEYIQTFNITIPLKYFSAKKKKYAVICSSKKDGWIAQDWGEISDKKVLFRNMGVGNLYMAMYYNNGEYSPASDPFILNEKGEIAYLSPSRNKTQTVFLLRKFPLFRQIRAYHERMVKGRFQGANRRDFKDSVTLYAITATPQKIETVNLSNASKFRYVRFYSALPGKGDVAELEFYGGAKKSDTLKLEGRPTGFPEVLHSIGTPYQKAFDGDIDTYFSAFYANSVNWAGLDLGKPKRITKIKYCPRSDTNFIVPGDRYELCYWKKDQWISMGEQTTKDAFLKYENVPSDGLYLLHNLSRGKEERIFTYEGGKQVFW